MQNGTYAVRMAAVPGSLYKLTARNGKYKLYDIHAQTTSIISEDLIGSIYVVEKQLDKVDKKYDLRYYVDGVATETIYLGGSYALAKWNANKLKNSTHKLGCLSIIERV